VKTKPHKFPFGVNWAFLLRFQDVYSGFRLFEKFIWLLCIFETHIFNKF